MNLRNNASVGILSAYIGSETQDHRRNVNMKIKCGMHTYQIKPFVSTKRRKTYADVSKNFDEKIEKLAKKINKVYHLTNYGDISHLPWSFEDIFTVLNLS